MPQPSGSDTPQPKKQEPLLGWMITRPVIDRFLLLGFAKVSAICLVIFVGILIFVVATIKHKPSFLATLGMLGVMVGGVTVCLLIALGVLKLMHRKGMVQVFMLTETNAQFVYGKNFQGGYESLCQLVGTAGVLSGDLDLAGIALRERNNQDVPWGAILKYREHPENLAITLYHKIAPVMRLYCPNQEIYHQALEIVQQRSAAGSQAEQ
ncbi:MAG: hypothetical protein KQH53_14210 [Desulfarculaceae bacterium]|nr:hypothetical protein [Desulfarculaceae bacterium]